MAYRKLRTLGSYISMLRNRDRWPTKDPDSCISRLAASGIGASLESFSLTLVDVDLEEGGLFGPIHIVALVTEVYDLSRSHDIGVPSFRSSLISSSPSVSD